VPLLGKQQEVLHLCELSFALDFAIVFLFSFCLLLLFSKKPKPKIQKTSVASVTMLDELRRSFSKLSLNEILTYNMLLISILSTTLPMKGNNYKA
jgi:hypothetical protein